MAGRRALGSTARWVAAWLARGFLGLVAVLFLAGPPDPVSAAPLGAEFYVLGAAFLAGLLATFEQTATIGWALVLFAVWSMFTLYGVTAVLDPSSVISDSQRSGSRAPHLTSDAGAYVVGAVVLAIANTPVAAWLWSRSSWAVARRQKRRDLLLGGGGPTLSPVVAPVEDRRRERRQASRRRRKRRSRR